MVLDESRQDLSGRISIALNNRLLGQRRDLDTVLRDGDVLMLFPAFEGG
jgi:molybdopterin converting factor small subunit